MANDVGAQMDSAELSRLVRIARDLAAVEKKILAVRPDSQIVIKSFSVRHKLARDGDYDSRWFVVMRARYGTRDLVKFRRLGTLANLPTVLLDMLRTESDWRDDRFGSDANLE